MKIIAIVYIVILSGLLWYHIPSQTELEQNMAWVASLEERVAEPDCQESINGIIVSKNAGTSTLISLHGVLYECS